MAVRKTLSESKAENQTEPKAETVTRASRAGVEADEAAPKTRSRRRKATVNEDQFYIPPEEIPADLSYEWKRWSVSGQHDPYYIAQMREQGWEPVPPERHPNWVPPGYKEPHIIKGGMILMDRPIELTIEARAEMKAISKRQVREAEQRLGKTGDGEAGRSQPTVVKEYMRPVIVAED